MAHAFARPPSSVAEEEEGIAAVHQDIIQTHILTRLDGPTLAATSCASAQLRSLASHETLWANICRSNWPSTATPRLRRLISTFPNGSRSFFSDSYPLLTPTATINLPAKNPPPELTSAVDIFYREKLLFSKVIETETETGWFRCSPFRVDILDPKVVIPTPIPYMDGDEMCSELSRELSLSWIIIDPIGRRAMNVSTYKPVSVERHWLSCEMQVRFATILAGERGTATEFVQCGIVVAIGGEMQVTETSLQVEDMDGMILNGRDSLVILEKALGRGKMGIKKNREMEGKRTYEVYVENKRERKARKLRNEEMLDTMCVVIGVLLFGFFWIFMIFR